MNKIQSKSLDFATQALHSKQERSRSSKQALHKYFKPVPEKLGRLIEIVNLIPLEQALPPLPLPKEDWLDFAQEALDVCLRMLPKFFGDYVWSNLVDNEDSREQALWQAVTNYQQFEHYRDNLRAVIQLGQASPDDILIFLTSVNGQYELYIDKDGKVNIGTDFFADAVQGVEAKRIRECQACSRIFWAGRITQKGCSPACANRIRVDKWRKNYPEKYKLQRVKRADQQEQQRSAISVKKRGIINKKGER